jgi:hypothetical protein
MFEVGFPIIGGLEKFRFGHSDGRKPIRSVAQNSFFAKFSADNKGNTLHSRPKIRD